LFKIEGSEVRQVILVEFRGLSEARESMASTEVRGDFEGDTTKWQR
jgi:hypothetical protein